MGKHARQKSEIIRGDNQHGHTLEFECVPSAKKLREMYVIFDGRRIAYRGQPGRRVSERRSGGAFSVASARCNQASAGRAGRSLRRVGHNPCGGRWLASPFRNQRLGSALKLWVCRRCP